jgi:hypothetical protein
MKICIVIKMILFLLTIKMEPMIFTGLFTILFQKAQGELFIALFLQSWHVTHDCMIGSRIFGCGLEA